MRRIGVLMNFARGRSGSAAPPRGVPARAAAIGLDGGPQRPDRHPLERERCRARSQIRGRIGCARAGRHPDRGQSDHRALIAGDPHLADRVRAGRRSGRRRLRRKPGAARRQRHRIHHVRIRHRREMAGTAQGDRAARDASGSPARSRERRRIGQFGAIQSAAPSFGVEVRPISLRDAGEIERGIAAFARESNGGLIVTGARRRRSFIAI